MAVWITIREAATIANDDDMIARTELVLILLVVTISSCRSVSARPSGLPDYAAPADFVDDDIVGIWQAVYGGSDTDTITIRPDGTYKQVFMTAGGYSYEGSWNNWWIERRSSGCIYLHLEGMRYFVGSLEKAEAMANGVTVTLLEACEFRAVQVSADMILTITGTPSQGGHIELLQLRADPDSGDKYFLPIGAGIPET